VNQADSLLLNYFLLLFLGAFFLGTAIFSTLTLLVAAVLVLLPFFGFLHIFE
jgi:hypothetical protein